MENSCSQHALHHKMLCSNLDQKLEKGCCLLNYALIYACNIYFQSKEKMMRGTRRGCVRLVVSVRRFTHTLRGMNIIYTWLVVRDINPHIKRHITLSLCKTNGKFKTVYPHIERHEHYLCIRFVVSLRQFTPVMFQPSIVIENQSIVIAF